MNDNNDLSHHILPNSATMVGVCIMVVSIVKSLPPDAVNYFIDKALAVDCVLSFSRAFHLTFCGNSQPFTIGKRISSNVE